MGKQGPINVVVLGAGVIGLTEAMLLAKDGRFNVTVVGKHMPGDYDIEYASPWAGASYVPVGKEGSLLQKLEGDTFKELARLSKEAPETAIYFVKTYSYSREKDLTGPVGDWTAESVKESPWWKDLVPNFRILNKTELPTGWDAGTGYQGLTINTAIYLPWLLGQCLKHGATVKRGIASNIADAADMHSLGKRADLVINATGLGALKLGGVADTKMYPARGQIVVVRNDPGMMSQSSGTDDAPDEAMYIIPRAAGGGTILGGCLQHNSWDPQPDPNMAVRIMKRCVEMCPSLAGKGKGIEGLSVVRHSVGLRPMREGGPRVERDVVDGIEVVHSYGHGGYGYQSSYGTAYMVMGLVEQFVKGEKARL